MVVTRQSLKAFAAGSEVVSPSTTTLDSNIPSDYEESPIPQKAKRHRVAPPVVYVPLEIIENLSDAHASKLKEKYLDVVAWKHGIPHDSVLLPTRDRRDYNPHEGYIAWSRYHCTVGGIPPLNGYLINFYNYLECAPFQLHHNPVVIITLL